MQQLLVVYHHIKDLVMATFLDISIIQPVQNVKLSTMEDAIQVKTISRHNMIVNVNVNVSLSVLLIILFTSIVVCPPTCTPNFCKENVGAMCSL